MGRTSDAKERLLEAALDLIWTNSYGGVSVDQICEQAGVNKGSFYHFFPSKTDLAIAALEAGWQHWKVQYDAVFSVQSAPLDRLRNWCELFRDEQRVMVQKHGRICGCPISTLGSEVAAQEEKLRLACQDLFDRDRLYLQSTIAEAQSLGQIMAGDPLAIASCVQALALGFLQQARIRNDLGVLDNMELALFRLLGSGPKTS